MSVKIYRLIIYFRDRVIKMGKIAISSSKFLRTLQRDQNYEKFINSDLEKILNRVIKRLLPDRLHSRSQLDPCIKACIENFKSRSTLTQIIFQSTNIDTSVKNYIYKVFDNCIKKAKINIEKTRKVRTLTYANENTNVLE